MEKRILEQIAGEALPFHEIQRLKEERRRLESVEPPPRAELDSWREEKEAWCDSEIKRISESIVDVGRKRCESIFSSETLISEVEKVMDIGNMTKPVIFREYLPILQELMENALHAHSMRVYGSRFRDIDGLIDGWLRKVPKPFEPSMINVDKRYPIERIGFLSSGHSDKWLSEALGGKPIMFTPVEKYQERLIEFYRTVYLPAMRAEEERAKQVEPSPTEEPKPVSTPPPSSLEDRSWMMRSMKIHKKQLAMGDYNARVEEDDL